MDENIIIAAHHEAGHALMAYIVGWTINSVELNIQNDQLNYGVTNYNFGEAINNSYIDRRLHCLMGGPISQTLYQNNELIDIDTLGPDGDLIDNLLDQLNKSDKEHTIQESIYATATILNIKDNINAIRQIVDILMERHSITPCEFHQIMNINNVKRMDFNS